jgi:hypothetical protein
MTAHATLARLAADVADAVAALTSEPIDSTDAMLLEFPLLSLLGSSEDLRVALDAMEMAAKSDAECRVLELSEFKFDRDLARRTLEKRAAA